MRFSRFISSMMLAVTLSAPQAFAYSDLDVSAGTMTLGGVIAFPMTFNRTQAKSFVTAEIAPQFGYFVIDSLELFVGASYGRVLWSGNPQFQPNNNWGVEAGLDYYFDIGSPAFPYLGAQGWFQWHGNGTDIQIKVPLGVLVSLNEYVAINFGVPVVVAFAAGKTDAAQNGYTSVSLDPGYLGLKAFF